MEQIWSVIGSTWNVVALLVHLPVLAANSLNELTAGMPLSYHLQNPIIPTLVAVLGLLMLRHQLSIMKNLLTTIPMAGYFLWIIFLLTAFTAFYSVAHNTLLATLFLMMALAIGGRKYLLKLDRKIGNS